LCLRLTGLGDEDCKVGTDAEGAEAEPRIKHRALEKEMKEHAVRVEREHEQEVALVRQQAEAKEFLLMDCAGAAYEASARHHQHRLTAARDVRLFPPTWTSQLQFELVDVTDQLLQPAGETYLACMQALVDGTAGTYGHGRDQVVVGKYSKLKVVKVQRIENRIRFMAYHARRSGLLAEEGNRIVVKDCKSFRPWQRDLLDHRINDVPCNKRPQLHPENLQIWLE